MTMLISILFLLGLILKLFELFGSYIMIGLIVVVVCFIVFYRLIKKTDKKQQNDVLSKDFIDIAHGKKQNIKQNGIEFKNIETVDIINTEMTYRIEEREEFDIVMTNFLTEQDGWQHYETKTVEYEVPNGYEYTFLIYYKNGSKETRVYHESSNFAQRLISISENSSLQKNNC